jgi:hypothetical protein
LLPDFEVVEQAGQALQASVAADDKAGTQAALRNMGVFTLCPVFVDHFQRMEDAARRLPGRARQVMLVELSIFAAEVEDYERASKYAHEARASALGSWEEYNLSMVEGLVALSAGRTREAVQSLACSIRACLVDEYGSLDCGVRAPNLSLAQKLLIHGERVDVLSHLLQCRDIWQFLQKQLDKWIGAIEKGESPDFHASEFLRSMNQPATRIQMQWVLAAFPDAPRSGSPKSPDAVKAARERLRTKYRGTIDAAIEDKLNSDNTDSSDEPG